MPAFFADAEAFSEWLAQHHATATEVIVGFYKRATGRPSMTWPESVEAALRYGWIDGIRRSHDAISYTIRFTPRKAGSVWSNVNIRTAQKLIDERHMTPAGRRAFDARKENRAGIYSYEQRSVDLPAPYARLMKKNRAAWEFFHAQPPSYRKVAMWFIVSAKKEETRLKRLETLIAHSARGERLPGATPQRVIRTRPR
jgi:uncharacterized protein YdeI (YjbR/CyaY-like superfamily)